MLQLTAGREKRETGCREEEEAKEECDMKSARAKYVKRPA